MLNNFMEHVYHVKQYQPFQFHHDYDAVCEHFHQTVVIHHGYAIVTAASNKNRSNANALHAMICSNDLLTKHGFHILKWENQTLTSDDVIDEFRFYLLDHMWQWEKRFFAMVLEHFNNRVSEGRVLTQHNSIKILIGKIVTTLSMTQETIFSSKTSQTQLYRPDLLLLAANNIKQIALDLHQLAGGRAFVQGNIIEMHCLFEIFRKVYFQGRTI